jgi:hypothetical protein
MKKCNATASDCKSNSRSIGTCEETIRQIVAFSVRRSNANNVDGDKRRYSNVVSNGTTTIRVAEYSGRLLEAPVA